MATGDVPEIGTDLRVRVLGHTTGGHYKVEAVSPPTGRPLLLAVRHGSAPPAVGAELDVWVLRHDSTVSFVTADERGRKPISPTMAKRYVSALGVLEELAGGSVPADARPRLSELKGMANRCLRLDQHDWLDVWHVLGSPDRPRLSLLRDLAVNTGRALATDPPDLERIRADLERSGWADALAESRQTLRQRLADPMVETEEPLSPPQQPEPKESDPMPTTAGTAAPKAEPSTGLRLALEASAAADRGCKTHEAVRFELMAALLRANRQPDHSPIVDVGCTTEQGLFLYEVLGAGLSAHADLRSGAARLLEINRTLPSPADRLYLVLSEPPAEDWSADAIHDVFGVRVLWRSPNGWGGENADTAFRHPA